MPRDRSDEYYAEEEFGGHVSGGRIYTGPLLMVGFGVIIGCFCMATMTKVCFLGGAGGGAVLPVHVTRMACDAWQRE
jgi:hypothetical protein